MQKRLVTSCYNRNRLEFTSVTHLLYVTFCNRLSSKIETVNVSRNRNVTGYFGEISLFWA